MSARSLFDTNVLVYADDKAAPAKQRRNFSAKLPRNRRSRSLPL
jgi:predicted nucleic acid-binding protein